MPRPIWATSSAASSRRGCSDGFRSSGSGFQEKDEEISDSRIVISSGARNLPCRPINDALETHFPTLFHAASALSAPSGHLPLEGKADDTREPAIKSPSGIASIYTSRRFHILCAAPPFLISHFSFLIRAKLSSAIHGRGAHELTLPPQTAAFAAVFLDFLPK